MNAVTVKFMMELAQIQIEVEAMKAANAERERRGESQAYPEAAFQSKADLVGSLHNELHGMFLEGFAL